MPRFDLIGVVLVAWCIPAAAADPATGPILRTEFGDVEIFPADNAWNTPIDTLPVHPNSANFVASIGPDKPLHPDFGTVWKGQPSGIPFDVVPGNQQQVPIAFRYADESDAGPYPIPDTAKIEGGPPSDGDRHVIVVDPVNKKLYEVFRAFKKESGWEGGSGAVFDLSSNKLRPQGWTSADAAGLPIFPGLVRYDEVVEQKEIRHALRFTCRKTTRGYILPATHWASSSKDPNLPPMGLRMRLRADFDDSKLSPEMRVITRALKKYGLILADNGGDWFVSGSPNPKWNDDDVQTLKRIKGRDFEAVDSGPIVTR